MIDVVIRVGLVNKRTFVAQWLDPKTGEWSDVYCPNRIELARTIAITAARVVRGEAPDTTEKIDINVLTTRRSTDP